MVILWASSGDPEWLCWPIGGEVDIYEAYGPHLNSSIAGTLHYAYQCYNDASNPNTNSGTYKNPPNFTDWNVIGATWNASTITWYVNDPSNVFWSMSAQEYPSWGEVYMPQTPMYVILNTAICPYGWAGKECGSPGPDPATWTPIYHRIDYFRYYTWQPDSEEVTTDVQPAQP
jgi:hypothetical protein